LVLGLMTIELLLPLLSLLVFIYTGKFFNPYGLYFYISILLMLVALSCMYPAMERVIFYHFILFCLVQVVCVVAHMIALGPAGGAFEGLRTISSFYTYWYLGYVCYFVFYRTGKMDVLLRWIVNVGLFIAVVNIIHFYFNTVLGNYRGVRDYLSIMNKDLLEYLDTVEVNGFLRHAGYFLDTHSQFYIPGTAFLILLTGKIKVKFRNLEITIILISVAISGIKTAYLIILVMWFVVLIRQNVKAAFGFALALFLCSVAAVVFLTDEVANLFVVMFTHDMDILIEHITHNPLVLMDKYTLVFFIGGNPNLVQDLYSEVYLITTLYFIGIVGLLFYISPLFVFWVNRKEKYYLGSILFLYFLLSLGHYPVYKVGVNNLAAALPLVYFFAALTDFKSGSNS